MKTMPCVVNEKIYSVADLTNVINGRDLYIWGAALKGKSTIAAMERNNIKIKGLLILLKT